MVRSSLLPPLCLSLLWLAACAASALPPSCVGLRGVQVVPVEQADRSVTIRYIYTEETTRLPHLQCRADQDERVAMVELARALERGNGIVRDDVRAAALYEKAAQDQPAFTSIYASPVRISGSGQVMTIPNADGGPGNAEAKYRLGQMLAEGRGIGQDVARGRELMAAARRQGFEP